MSNHVMTREEAHEVARAACRKVWLQRNGYTEKDLRHEDGKYFVIVACKVTPYISTYYVEYLPEDICRDIAL